MAFTHQHINAFVIVGGDSDFISLVEKLKQYDKKVFVVGGRQFTSGILQRNCHEFVAYENLIGASGGGRRQSGRDVKVDRAPIEQAIPLVTRALKVLADREVSPQLGLLKSTLLQLDSTFSERSYGAGSFRDFAQKLEKVGVLRVHQGKGGWLVGPAEGRSAAVENGGAHEDAEMGEQPPAVEPRAASAAAPPAAGSVPSAAGTPADGLRVFREMLLQAEIRRWPMYLRNVKQMVRQTNPSFDERAYGFANLADLLRAAHRDGAVRVERDRQGVIRVFQVNGAPGASRRPESAVPILDVEDEAVDLTPDPEAPLPVAAAASELGVPVAMVQQPADDEPDAGRGVDSEALTADPGGAEPSAPRRRRRTRSPAAGTRGRRTKRTVN
jgi:hypothetical protein